MFDIYTYYVFNLQGRIGYCKTQVQNITCNLLLLLVSRFFITSNTWRKKDQDFCLVTRIWSDNGWWGPILFGSGCQRMATKWKFPSVFSFSFSYIAFKVKHVFKKICMLKQEWLNLFFNKTTGKLPCKYTNPQSCLLLFLWHHALVCTHLLKHAGMNMRGSLLK